MPNTTPIKREEEDFLNHLKSMLHYWENLENKTLRERMEGVVFSVLVAIDGEASDTGPYSLRAVDENGNEGDDIAGGLHGSFLAKMKPWPTPNNQERNWGKNGVIFTLERTKRTNSRQLLK